MVADTDEKAQEIGKGFLWAQQHRMRGPVEHVDPPGYQSRVASQMSSRRLGAGGGPPMTYQDLQDVNAVVVGSPQTVISKLKDAFGFLLVCHALCLYRLTCFPHLPEKHLGDIPRRI